ncbi:MAG TPA: adenylyltransferase/cytidyltransferase family protein [Candidatus Avipropionibacterium avicola]|uniref:Adenylyltransferase/cytidyltransferase family protein n=1 Tax=Candidatus Avipropionibacterium avicola TaxID=2840701 RepID=A0A9D1GZQ8_9ACTN|nr:adenylyltransferase/cytidyltransferase family protein [Candidatus Avipropionibacterium avicola]
MFHLGHLTILCRARESCDHLIVGVVSDEALLEVRGHLPLVPQEERLEIIRAIDVVDAVVLDRGGSKVNVWRHTPFDVLFKGDDWRGTPKGDALERDMGSVGVRVHYFPYTPHVSSTGLRARVSTRVH